MNERTVVKVGLALFLLAGAVGCKAGEKSPAQTQAVATVPPAAVETVTVKSADLEEGIDVVGSLAPRYMAEVKSEYSGILSAVYVTEWQPVHKGMPLARLDTREAELILQKAKAGVAIAEAGLKQAEVSRQRADREYARLSRLLEAGLVTRQAMDDATTARDAAQAQVDAARTQITAAEEEVRHAQTRLSKALIVSPMDGVVAKRDANVGDLAGEMGSPRILFQIVDNRLLDLTVTVPSWEMEHLKTGQALTFRTDAIPGREFRGEVKRINPSVDPADRAVKVQAEVRNASGELKGGLFVKGRIATGKRSGVLQIPRVSLLNWDLTRGRADVFVVEGGRSVRKTVGTGTASGDQVEITSGLSAGQQVITRGAFGVKDGGAVTVSPRQGA